MENIYQMCYSLSHETSGNRATTGKASPTGNPVVKSGQEPVGGSECHKLFCKFGVPMVSDISNKRVERLATTTHSWSSTQAYQSTKGEARKTASKRSVSCWLSNRYVDITASGRSNRPSVRHSVSSFPCLETSRKYEVELPETGTPSPATGRRQNRSLETISMASYKKTRHNVGPIWCFLMKAAFYSSPLSDARGLQKERRRTSIISTSKTVFLLSVPLPYPPKESASLSISAIRPRISTVSMSGLFSGPYLNIFEDLWSCSGMAVQSTDGKKSHNLLSGIQGSKSNGSRHMHLNSTLLNMFGIKPTALSQTARRKIYQRSASCCDVLSANYEDRKIFFGPASMRPSFLGQDNCFHYLCKAQ
jgi:hypothetical protein